LDPLRSSVTAGTPGLDATTRAAEISQALDVDHGAISDGRTFDGRDLLLDLTKRHVVDVSKGPAHGAVRLLSQLDCPYKVTYTSFVASTRDVRIEIRLKMRENRAWRAAAKRSDLTLSEWIRHMCNTGAPPPPSPVPPVVQGDQIELPFTKTKRKLSS